MSTQADKKRPSILLIDDSEAGLQGLFDELSKQLGNGGVEIRKWMPSASEGSPRDVFHSFVDERTMLVITDYDLTSKGKTGLFGPSIVDWCQIRAIPVG